MRIPTPAPARTSSRLDQVIDLAITAGLAVLILVGFATSYRTLRDLAATTGGYPHWLSPAVPLSFDLGIVVLSLKVTRAARDGRTAPIVRLLVASLSAATVAANAAAAATPTARLLHAVPPAMFIVCFESVIITARRNALHRMRLLPTQLPRLRPARWLLAPRSSWTLWRSMVLGMETTETAAAVVTNPPGTADRRLVRAAVKDDAVARIRNGAGRRPSTQHSGVFDTTARGRVVAELLAAEPAMTSPQLAVRLRTQGHTVSVRTAQRLRSRVLEGGDRGEFEPMTHLSVAAIGAAHSGRA